VARKAGSTATGTADANSGTIATGAKDTLNTNVDMIDVEVKWEWDGVGTKAAVSTITDSAGNNYVIESQSIVSTTKPALAIAYCLNPKRSATNVVTVTFDQATASFRRVFQRGWTGVRSRQGAVTVNNGSGTNGVPGPTTGGAVTLTEPGIVIYAVAGFSTLTAIVGTGSPMPGELDDPTLTEAYCVLYRVTSPMTLTAGSTHTPGGGVVWDSATMAFADASDAFTHDITRAALLAQPGIPNSAMRDARSWF
jgi:hypothetical protein